MSISLRTRKIQTDRESGVFDGEFFPGRIFSDKKDRIGYITSSSDLNIYKIGNLEYFDERHSLDSSHEFRSVLLVEGDVLLTGDYGGVLRRWKLPEFSSEIISKKHLGILWTLRKIADYLVVCAGNDGHIHFVEAIEKDWMKSIAFTTIPCGSICGDYIWDVHRLKTKSLDDKIVVAGRMKLGFLQIPMKRFQKKSFSSSESATMRNKSRDVLNLNVPHEKNENDRTHYDHDHLFALGSFIRRTDSREILFCSSANVNRLFLIEAVTRKVLEPLIIPQIRQHGLRTVVELDNNKFIFGGNNGNIILFDSQILKFKSLAEGFHKGDIYCLVLSKNKKLLITGSYSDKKVWLHNINGYVPEKDSMQEKVDLAERIEFFIEDLAQDEHVGTTTTFSFNEKEFAFPKNFLLL